MVHVLTMYTIHASNQTHVYRYVYGAEVRRRHKTWIPLLWRWNWMLNNFCLIYVWAMFIWAIRWPPPPSKIKRMSLRPGKTRLAWVSTWSDQVSLCPMSMRQAKLGKTWAYAQSDQSLHCALSWVTMDPSFLYAECVTLIGLSWCL